MSRDAAVEEEALVMGRRFAEQVFAKLGKKGQVELHLSRDALAGILAAALGAAWDEPPKHLRSAP